MQQQTKFLDHDGIHCKANPWAVPRELTGPSDVTLTCAEKSYILLRMSPRHVSARAAIELALIGVTPLCVADILCR